MGSSFVSPRRAMMAEGDRFLLHAPEQVEVDLEPGHEHQQDLADLAEEIGDRSRLAEDFQAIRSDQHAAQQQTNDGRDAQAIAELGDDDDETEPQRELDEQRQRERVRP